MASWMEEEFGKRLGEHEAFAYLRTYAGMATFQIAEVLPRFSILSVDAVAAAIDSPEPPAFMAEEAHSHTSTNYFAIPLGIAYPEWMGTAVLSVSSVVAFILKEPRAQPPLDTTHRDIWEGWTSAWYQQGGMGWQTLRPARTGAFFAWYVDRLNELLDRISSFESTASAVTGEIKPLKQIALIRSVFQLQDLVGRMLITSDPYGRATWAMLALARFDDLGWGFDLISDPDRMTELMKRLGEDAEIGNLYLTYGLRVWRRVMEGILKGAAGELIDGNAKIRLADGETMPSSRYVREYLRAVRNTIHRFTSDTMEDGEALPARPARPHGRRGRAHGPRHGALTSSQGPAGQAHPRSLSGAMIKLAVIVAEDEMPDSTVPFDAGAEAALRLAETEAQRLAVGHIGTEHVLLGVASNVDGVGARVLREFGIDLERIQSAIQLMASARPIGGGWRATARIVPSAQASPSETSTPTAAGDKPAWSPRANKAIGLAQDDARRLNHSHVGTGHLLLGLIREGDNMATGILASHGVQRRVPRRATRGGSSGGRAEESRRLSAAYLEAIRDRVLAVFAQSSP